ncbi:MAG: hypothetical protein KBT29_02685 [Prevotellaceae bacterium]|nr:hypothetical protein [Candidatus Minthosoma caballi]
MVALLLVEIITLQEGVPYYVLESIGINFFSANREVLSTKSGRIQGKCQPEQY